MNGEDEYQLHEIDLEVSRIAHAWTVDEIFEAGFKAGQACAGLNSNADRAFRAFIVDRLEARKS